MTLSREIQRVIIYSGKCRKMQGNAENAGKCEKCRECREMQGMQENAENAGNAGKCGKCREMQETGMNMGKGVGENDWESRYW